MITLFTSSTNSMPMLPLEVTSQGMLVYCQTLLPTIIQYPKLALRVSSEAAIDYLVDHIKWLMPKSNITVLSDEDAHNGYIFKKEGGNGLTVTIIIMHMMS